MCRFFQTGQCIAADCKFLHELPKSSSAKPSASAGMPLLARNDDRTNTVLPCQPKTRPSKPRETVEPSPLEHFPFSSVVDLSVEETAFSARKADDCFQMHSNLPRNPEPPQQNQPMRGWLPDPRPARVCLYHVSVAMTSSQML